MDENIIGIIAAVALGLISMASALIEKRSRKAARGRGAAEPEVPDLAADIPADPLDIPADPLDIPAGPLDIPAEALNIPADPLNIPAGPLDAPSGSVPAKEAGHRKTGRRMQDPTPVPVQAPPQAAPAPAEASGKKRIPDRRNLIVYTAVMHPKFKEEQHPF